MGEKTGIAWTDHTFNPWIGCTEVGPGCDNCYARELDARHKWGGKKHWGIHVPRHRTAESSWNDVLKWDRKAAAAGVSRRVFCASLADVFDNEVPEAWRRDLWNLIIATQNLSWLLVTKRIGNVARMVPPAYHRNGWPDNVRLLITVCNQEEADRDIPKLLALPCKNGISYEPALGPIEWGLTRAPNDQDYRGWDGDGPIQSVITERGQRLGWIIVGGESTQGAGKARPFDLAWARSTIAQGKAAGVAVFVKQLGSLHLADGKVWAPAYGTNRAGADPAEWPEDLRVQEFPS